MEDLIKKERQVHIRKELYSLPPNQAAAMILRHYEGLSCAEIAQILGVTPKPVEGLIGHARTSLQACLPHFKKNHFLAGVFSLSSVYTLLEGDGDEL
jgi:DNA-directed RNA polymerase specialized sigma24 family protein